MITVARLKIKEIDRDQTKQWILANNSTVPENLTSYIKIQNSLRVYFLILLYNIISNYLYLRINKKY